MDYKLGALLGSVGHRVKIHSITPVTGKERGDLEIKDYVVMQKPQPQDNRLSSSHSDHGLYHDPYSVWVFTCTPSSVPTVHQNKNGYPVHPGIQAHE